MTDRIISFPERRTRDLTERLMNDRRASGEPPLDPILEKLKADDWSRDWYPKFASNLGEMATRLNSAEPKKAAKGMFIEAFGQDAGDANWRKRKRYLRFVGEESAYDRDGEYVASKEPYLNLAKSYARLCYPKDSYAFTKALRLLVKGTSLGPTVDVSQIDGITQAVACLKRIQEKCVEDPEISEAFSYLNKFPLAPFAADELKRDHSASNPWRRDLRDYSLTVPHRGKGLTIVPVQTSTISEYILQVSSAVEQQLNINSDYTYKWKFPWYVGRLLLGYLYFPEVIASIKLSLLKDDFEDQLFAIETDRTSDPYRTDEDDMDFGFVSGLMNKALDEKSYMIFHLTTGIINMR